MNSTRLRTAFVLALALLATVGAAPLDQAPSMEDLLKKADDYVADYAQKVSGVTLEEQFVLTELAGGQIRGIRRIGSDLVLVNTGAGLMSIRDVYSIDTIATRPRTARIIRLLAEPSVANWNLAQARAQESAHYFSAQIVLRYGDPLLALTLVRPEHHPKFTYKIEGQKSKNNVQLTVVGFKENRLPQGGTYVLNTPANAAASGRFLIDPRTGAIHQSELWTQSELEVARVTIDYAPDPALKLLLPSEANQTYEDRQPPTELSNMGSGGARKLLQLESRAKYNNATYTKVDLTRVVR